ncbi:MAG: hypothetical protein HY834_00685 [Devosia nanyangense]|uniref:Uncharacterized protein n=1 Tax=Devosia nanyangense TaxID=1228055 RepID=A0A933NUW8_9HYPH|nr:hypothetical protein [Devosia nanyangense]
MFKALLFGAALAFFALPAAAAELGRVDFNGRIVVLSDDNTWAYAETSALDCGTATPVASTKIKIAACIDLDDWNAGQGSGDQEFVYFSKDGNVGFAYITETAYAPIDAYHDAIIQYATQQSGFAAGSVTPFEEGEQTINGKTWNSMHYKVTVQGNELEFINYFYSEPALGSTQFVFWSLPAMTESAKALAEKVMSTVTIAD